MCVTNFVIPRDIVDEFVALDHASATDTTLQSFSKPGRKPAGVGRKRILLTARIGASRAGPFSIYGTCGSVHDRCEDLFIVKVAW